MQEARRRLLDRLRSWTVHDRDADGLWAGRSPLDPRPFVEEVDGWKAELEEALAEMAALRLALDAISKRYFEGREVLFADMEDAIARIGDGLAALAEVYNGWPGEERRSLHSTLNAEAADADTFLIDASSMDEEARQGAAALVSYLVDMAKAEAVDMMGDRRGAVALARRHLGFAG